MSIKKAAKHYGIPRSTIRFRLAKENQTVFRSGPATILTQEEESELENWLFDMQKRGFPVSKSMLLDNVRKYLDANPRTKKLSENVPGRTWMQLFIKRHPKISLRTPEFVTKGLVLLCL
ncbi:uncharacterized protein LOC129728187 [Wyeomyia smithii]|uniref:uncharacterized protein LOC129728187 n=1 Tax=Wyeomyia smithii TaxID=174621 RepID=UPI002467C578|nr:uncharacterized protein LOC129728187 [Wyeomyia smithii]